ncbi:SDR family NAD(P)-dependent oxidoreductase [Actibacterium sp. 188UL27-1]|uniref:SDR family NAD(P)-dependent oxidoreductase n=1 Tax=Actibacterium sp. 188UL27-1 TaxID=2786961 RepID=UPI00195EAEC8|nr:SDR family NAD(P)-dependent oxidoreductase [Actibacterium sp. 188UL27-1]MBM7067996.1 SDR family oxidoreductase [Actibacterium sp. 188UL27-1]
MNTYDLTGKVAVVTGGAQGLGEAVLRRLYLSGARVASWDANLARNEVTCAQLGPDLLAVPCDVANAGSVADALAATEAKFGGVDILVNSAGIAGPNAPVAAYELTAWEQIVAVNLTGTFLVNRAMVPGMEGRNYGRIVNIASIAGKEGNPNACAYSASKAGVIGFTKSLGKELAGHDIAVNCVTPAAARTPIFDQMSEEHITYMLSKIPRNRFLEVEEAASMVVWLVSAENSFTTAGVFDLSGGRATY